MELKDIFEMKALEGNGMSPYEQFKVQSMQTRSHTSGVGIAGLVTGVAGVVIAAGGWLFGGMYSNAKTKQAQEAANSAKELANVQIAASQRQIDQLTSLLASERSERLQGDYTISQTITDTVSGSQSGQLTAMQQAELNATQQVMLGLQTGQYSQNPIKVVRVSGQRECGCDSCGCNG